MQYYFAPMEGLTDRIYRNLHHAVFPGVDRYYTPFISASVHHTLTPREILELPRADSVSLTVIPQILTKVPEDFLWLAEQCRDLGYREINLNVGCPSGTVVSKGKGAGMLADPDTLDRFLDKIFCHAPLPISVKTRIGLNDSAELPRLMEVYNRYPVAELIVHPRIRKDFYRSPINWDAFEYVLSNSKNSVCYNGNLCSSADIQNFSRKYPQVSSVMIGRGLIGDPGMVSVGGTTRERLSAFNTQLLEHYLKEFGGSRNAMFRLKENWRYLLCHFDHTEKLGKQLRKTTDLSEYRRITSEIIHTLPMKDHLEPDW